MEPIFLEAIERVSVTKGIEITDSDLILGDVDVDREIEKMKELLIAEGVIKGTFLVNISHDLNTRTTHISVEGQRIRGVSRAKLS